VAGSGECDDEVSGSGATALVSYRTVLAGYNNNFHLFKSQHCSQCFYTITTKNGSFQLHTRGIPFMLCVQSNVLDRQI
jgi:hypothetical protein